MAFTPREAAILRSIKVASENNPNKPEFPADHPKFPASRTYRITVPGFTNVWIKDESTNPTGTHKDRMAWEVIVTYRDFLLAKKRGQRIGALPHLSIISSGSSAIAIQTLLRRYHLPHLKVLIDAGLESAYVQELLRLGCELFTTDLGKKKLGWREILYLTHNEDGLDITSAEALDPTTRFYDWLSYEILNTSPEYCFIPFGTGNLYENILNITKREVSTMMHDPRFQGDVKKIRECNFFGATSNNPRTQATKLYSPHLPFVHYDEQWIRLYRYAGFCGRRSNVFLVKEEFLERAARIAAAQKINCEYSGIAGLALLLQMRHSVPRTKKILIVNTGKTKIG